jgi:hypothetical protein
MKPLVAIALMVVAAIHLVPLVGVFGADRIASLYGIAIDGADLEILLRHRAVLFGLLGIFFAYAVFRPAWRTAAFVAGFVSVVTFLALAFLVGDYGAPIRRVVIADIVALAFLVIGSIAHALDRRPSRP